MSVLLPSSSSSSSSSGSEATPALATSSAASSKHHARSMALKEHISSPLEAGPSVLDAHHLPPHLVPALEHVAGRLARKALHLTLVVVRKDYQLPAVALPYGSPSLTWPVTPVISPSAGAGASPASKFTLTSVSAGIKGLVRSRSRANLVELARHHRHDHKHSGSSLSSPRSDTSLRSLRARWPLSPTTPLLSSPPPMTPCTATSSATGTSDDLYAQPFELRLMHAPDLPLRARKDLHSALTKADKRFPTRGAELSPAQSPAAYGLPGALFNASLLQNEILFSTEGLTLVALDHLYSVKSALSVYSSTRSLLRLEDAVDELRRFVLAGRGAKISKADLLRSYDWLGVSSTAVEDLDAMYRRAYGGPERAGAIAGMPSPLPPPQVSRAAKTAVLEPVIWSQNDDYICDMTGEPWVPDLDVEESMIGVAITTPEPVRTCLPARGPTLRLQTKFETSPLPPRRAARDDGAYDGELTARPVDEQRAFVLGPYSNNPSIDQMLLGAGGGMKGITPTNCYPRAVTPNQYDEVSPITRSEWGFLVLDDAFKSGRMVAVETC
ncbi:hypothetical protein JDV02_007486 [Purpureocillium takamizusanense]|uniref:DUF7582 domain-containing protein n=1 Tax=Purpureocillium takamizusanense TaxID=2060973 RepID=A0A9Q8QN52_9HYPO|nr:uncharacterized protein JDV02_007486 [Purpureocillium takamizusanense]UNI21502.1 hypothetical protein JDV02_007486 [Purpureocillium takamizusanense]